MSKNILDALMKDKELMDQFEKGKVKSIKLILEVDAENFTFRHCISDNPLDIMIALGVNIFSRIFMKRMTSKEGKNGIDRGGKNQKDNTTS